MWRSGLSLINADACLHHKYVLLNLCRKSIVILSKVIRNPKKLGAIFIVSLSLHYLKSIYVKWSRIQDVEM